MLGFLDPPHSFKETYCSKKLRSFAQTISRKLFKPCFRRCLFKNQRFYQIISEMFPENIYLFNTRQATKTL